MKRLQQDAKRIPQLLLGLSLLAVGIYLTKLSAFGMAPWGVFHVGISDVTGIPFGFVTQIVGVVVMVLSIILFRTKIWIGTVLNVLMVGPLIVVLEELYHSQPTTLLMQLLVFTIGLLIMTFGRSLYIASHLGQGPRDGLFVGLARTIPFQVRTIKFSVDFIVFAAGFLLLLSNRAVLISTVGIGSALVVLLSGVLVQWYFSILGFDPKQSNY